MKEMILSIPDPNNPNVEIEVSSAPSNSVPIDSVPPDTLPMPDHATVICTDGSVHVIGRDDVNVTLPEDCGDPSQIPENQNIPVTEPVNTQDTIATVGESKEYLPATGNETQIMGKAGLLALVAGAVLLRLSRRPEPRHK